MSERMVTVCDNCLQASCWHGEFMCDASKFAGTVEKPLSELQALGLEHPHYWKESAHEN
jgi:hypothetical protein